MKFYQALEQWRSMVDLDRKPRTKKYHSEIVGIIRRHWPDSGQEISTITPRQVTDFAILIGDYSPPRFNAVLKALKAITPAASHLRRRRVTLKTRHDVNQMQFSTLLNELDNAHRGHAALIVRLLSQTGLRINEARQLCWNDVKSDYLSIPGEITKNGKPRIIPFINGLSETLERLRAITGTGKVIPQIDCRSALRYACKRAGLPRLTHHDFRHLFATRCLESGADLPTVAGWLGHSDGGVTLGKIYFHLNLSHSRQMAAMVKI